jgi:hypothetical protein
MWSDIDRGPQERCGLHGDKDMPMGSPQLRELGSPHKNRSSQRLNVQSKGGGTLGVWLETVCGVASGRGNLIILIL